MELAWRITRALTKVINRDGFSVMSENWNHLIILDACRYDIFEREIKNWNLEGKLEKRKSKASRTVEFLTRNFTERYPDVVYVTANPFVSLLLRGKFFKIIPVWDYGWSEEHKTVLPETVYEAALKAIRKYPDKRLIVHFMQPHTPFITLDVAGTTGFSGARTEVKLGEIEKIGDIVEWDLVRQGTLSREEAIKGYVENLRLAMPYVVKLCKILNGKVVVTSDHGEGFGEKALFVEVWGHPKDVMVKQLIEVPWLISNGRKKIDLDLVEKELIKIRSKRCLK